MCGYIAIDHSRLNAVLEGMMQRVFVVQAPGLVSFPQQRC